MSAVLAIDQGTTGTTALVVAADGRLLGRGYREFSQHLPSPGEVEGAVRRRWAGEWRRAVDTTLHWAATRGRPRR